MFELFAPPTRIQNQTDPQARIAITSRNSDCTTQIAAEVGYESEAAFNRAFKREFGLPPARFRSQSKSAEAKLAARGKSRLSE